MPKSTHEHQKKATNTGRKSRPDDENLYAREKREFQASEKAKKAEEKAAIESPEASEDRREE